MKCRRPNTDQEVELTIHANGKPCVEYALQTPTATQPDILECFVPVDVGDDLTIRGSFSGSCLQASFDLLADGSFLADKTINAPKTGEIKTYSQRKIEFKGVFNAPKDAGYKSLLSLEKVVEGYLHVKDMDDGSETAPSDQSAAAYGVGSLVVIVSMTQDANSKYTNKYPSITCGEHVDFRETVMTGGIPPAFELEFKTTKNDLSKHKQTKHKKHADQARFGGRPWATFIFYYRSQTILEAFDCSERQPDVSQELEPLDGTFVRGSTEKRVEGDGSKKDEDDSNLFVREHSPALYTPAPSASNKPSPIAESPPVSQMSADPPAEPATPAHDKVLAYVTPPSPGKVSPFGKKTLKGQPFNNLPDYPLSLQKANGKDKQDSHLQLSFVKFDHELAEMQKLQTSSSLTPLRTSERNLPEMMDDELKQTMNDAEAFLGAPSVHHQAAPVAHMTDREDDVDQHVNMLDAEGADTYVKHEDSELVPSPGTLNGSQSLVSQATSRDQTPTEVQQDSNMPSSQRSSRAPSQSDASGTMESECMVSADDIRARIPAEGITIKDLRESVGAELVPQNKHAAEVFLHLTKQVATSIDGRYYLKSAASSQKSSLSPDEQSTPRRRRDPNTIDVEAPSTRDLATSGQTPSRPSQEETRANAPVKMETASSIPSKRPADQATTSREPTPSSKRARFDSIANKKAEMLHKLEEKRKRNVASQKALEQQRKATEDAVRMREEAEERELAMLQQRMEEDDAEFEELERMRKEEAEAEREALEARQRVEEAMRAESVE